MNNKKTIECFENNDRLKKFKDSVNFIQKDKSVLVMFGDIEKHEDLCLIHVCTEKILNHAHFDYDCLERCSDLKITHLFNKIFYDVSSFDRKSKVEMLAQMTMKDYYKIVSDLFLEKWTDYFEHDFVLSDDNGRNLCIKTVGVDTDEDFYYQMFL